MTADLIDRIKTEADLTVVADWLRLPDLKKSGSKFIARCPNHDDTGRPNLVIYKSNVHCFACNYSADAIGLTAKVLFNDNRGDAIHWLRDRLGIRPQTAKGRRSDLGNKPTTTTATLYPKTTPLSTATATQRQPRPTTTVETNSVFAALDRFVASTLTEAPDFFPLTIDWSPESLGYKLPTPEGHWARLEDGSLSVTYDKPEDLITCVDLFKTIASPLELVEARRSLRVEVFARLLRHCLDADDPRNLGATWLLQNKSITRDTQKRFGVCWLHDWEAADRDLKQTFGSEVLCDLGLLDKRGDLHFKNHRLLYPFFVTTNGQRSPIYLQARNIHATKTPKGDGRFLRPASQTPSLYNVDAIRAARDAGQPIYICEGESDTLTANQNGLHAVGIVGANAFKNDWASLFAGLEVVVIPDPDAAGQKTIATLTKAFDLAGLPVFKVKRLPHGQDLTDFFTGKQSKRIEVTA